MADYQEIVGRYKDVPGGIIESYHALQNEFNYIPEDAIDVVAGIFDIPKAKAYGVATFYSYFKVGKRGKYVIRMCESAPCHVAGADEILKTLESYLGVKAGETTADGKFTLELTECVGQCQATPVITINSKPYGNLYPEKISSILSECK